MHIKVSEEVSVGEDTLNFIWAIEQGSSVLAEGSWFIEVFPAIKTHIDYFREEIAAALNSPRIVAAGSLQKRKNGLYELDFGAPTLEENGLCENGELNAGIGISFATAVVLEKSDRVENLINKKLRK